MEQPILSPGSNCWKLGRSARVKFLIDGAAYFSAVADALEQARESILILGWDFDSRIRLRPGSNRRDYAAQSLGKFLNSLAARRRGLQAHILIWDFAMIFALDREPVPFFGTNWRQHRRIHFQMDGNHPLGASHHSKIVVIDDAIAFAGGLDLAKGRWDTPQHRPEEPWRSDFNGNSLLPHHDVQLAVDGEVAAALGQLVRERWKRATGQGLRPPAVGQNRWPSSLAPDLIDVNVAIARTEPAYGESRGIREIETLLKDAIAGARHSIYVENQYLSSIAVGEALAARLRERDGPEIIAVVSKESVGWLEEATLDVLRSRLLKRLREADRYDRLRVYSPCLDGLAKGCMSVHSKVLVVDDRLARIGSANLSNRSMGLDTETDLAFEAEGRADLATGIGRFRNTLIAEHLGIPLETLTAVLDETGGSLIGAVGRLRQNGKRTLEPLDGAIPEWLDQMIPDSAIVDPESAIAAEKLVDAFVTPEERALTGSTMLRTVIILIVLFAIAATWRWTRLGEWLDVGALARWEASLRASDAAPVFILGAYILGGLTVFPVTILILATAFAFGPWQALIYSLIGCVLSAILIYAIGIRLGRRNVVRFTGRRLNRLNRLISKHGILAVAAIRLLPIAPYSVVNLAAGAARVRLRDFVIGTLIGMSPGVTAITFFEDQLERMIRHPNLVSLGMMAAILLLLLWGAATLHRWFGARRPRQQTQPSGLNR